MASPSVRKRGPLKGSQLQRSEIAADEDEVDVDVDPSKKTKQGVAAPAASVPPPEPAYYPLTFLTRYEDRVPQFLRAPLKWLARQDSSMLALLALTLLAVWSRLRNLTWADFVVFDEAYFSKYQNHYLTGKLYEDLHPPLGKMLLALPGWLFGYKGLYNFSWDTHYPDEFGLYPRRAFCALLGAALVPLAFGTCRALGCSVRAASLAALAVLWDPALTLISRHILLDPLLLFFSALAIYAMALFRSVRDEPFSRKWWFALTLDGFALGCVAGVKWVGLLSVSVVGIYTIADLWNLMGDRRVTNMAYLYHWLARIALLIVLPFCLYFSFFWVHFTLMTKTGVADAQMPPLFQLDLEGSKLLKQPRVVAYGSEITLRSLAPWGGLLHSHSAPYPGKDDGAHGSGQQQMTGFHHFDDNNVFIIQRKHGAGDGDGRIEYVRDGDVVRIVHKNTRMNLHSHRIPAPLHPTAYEASGYSGGNDPNDHWEIKILSDIDTTPSPHDPHNNKSVLRPCTAAFTIRHVRTGCYLGYHTVVLPAWGFKQYEIPCFTDSHQKLGSYAEWSVESVKDGRLPNGQPPKVPSKTSFPYFFKIFWATQVGMKAINDALIPEPGKQKGSMESEPLEWPLAQASMRLTGWDWNGPRLLLVGNVAVWWGGLVAVGLLAVAAALYTVGWRRGLVKISDTEFGRFMFGGIGVCVVGWLMHFAPFLAVARVTYLHHYMPALYYICLSLGFSVDWLTRILPKRVGDLVWVVTVITVVGVGVYFMGAAWGMSGPPKDWQGRKWRKEWQF